MTLVEQVDEFLEARLEWLALAPALVFAATPLIDLAIVFAEGSHYFGVRLIYHQVVAEFAFSAGSVLTLLLTAGVVRLKALDKLEAEPTRRRAMACFGALLVLALAATLANPDNYYRYSGVFPSLVGFGTYVVFFLVYFWSASFVRSDRLKRLFCLGMVGESVPVGIYALWLAAVHGGDKKLLVSRLPEGIFYNINHYGYFLTMVMVLAACLAVFEHSRRMRGLCLGVLAFNDVILLINSTMGCWLAALLALGVLVGVLAYLGHPLVRRAALALGLYVGLLPVVSIWDPVMLNSLARLLLDVRAISTGSKDADAAGSSRWRLWRLSVGYIGQKPLLGWGAEGFADELARRAGSTRPHNEFIMYAAYFGIPAALAYVAGCATVFVRAWRERLHLSAMTATCLFAALGYLVSSAFGNMYFYTTPFFMILLGFCVTTG